MRGIIGGMTFEGFFSHDSHLVFNMIKFIGQFVYLWNSASVVQGEKKGRQDRPNLSSLFG